MPVPTTIPLFAAATWYKVVILNLDLEFARDNKLSFLWSFATDLEKDSKVFDNCLNFEVKILPYKANDSWVTPALQEIKNCLNSDELPEESDGCDYCAYNRKIKLFG